MNEQMIFEKFPKIPRFNREIIITEKIDGTNAQVMVTEDRQVLPGSRNRWLTVNNDNYGFAAWVAEHEGELQRLGPGRHFGEWWGRGINRNYGLAHKRFSLFNVRRWCHWLPFAQWGMEEPTFEGDTERTPIPLCCNLVPVLYAGVFDTGVIQQVGHILKFDGSRVAPGFMNPEGIVIYHTAGKCLFKVTLEGDQPKGTHNGTKVTG